MSRAYERPNLLALDGVAIRVSATRAVPATLLVRESRLDAAPTGGARDAVGTVLVRAEPTRRTRRRGRLGDEARSAVVTNGWVFIAVQERAGLTIGTGAGTLMRSFAR